MIINVEMKIKWIRRARGKAMAFLVPDFFLMKKESLKMSGICFAILGLLIWISF